MVVLHVVLGLLVVVGAFLLVDKITGTGVLDALVLKVKDLLK